MKIQVVGNVLKDVYLGLDSRTENFERDKHNINWLDLSFDGSEHHFFRRFSSFGGAAVSLEVLEKLGLSTSVNNSDFTFNDNGPEKSTPAETYRYILTHDDHVSYLVPSGSQPTTFVAPDPAPDYLYIDRSAVITPEISWAIDQYLAKNLDTCLVLYLKNSENSALNSLIPRAKLVFYEETTELPANLAAVRISDRQISYGSITETISVDRIDTLTHLSAHSIIAATILGGFILGETVENSLKLAKLNVENATLDATLTLNELQNLLKSDYPTENLELIAASLMMKKKGILAADESGGSIKKKFAQLGIPDTFENRHNYRNIFFTTPHLEDYVNGIILFDETARDFADNGQTYVDFLTSKRIIPGIKVDQGLAPLSELVENPVENSALSEETYTKGLDGLEARLKDYYQMGLRFTKWRAAFTLTLSDTGEIATPTALAIEKNCDILAEYAKKCQSAGLVPIVEPEVVYDGYYPIEKCAEATGRILDELFKELASHGVNLRACILKVNMVLTGKQMKSGASPAKVGEMTATTLKNHVPTDLAGVVFLSGGQTVEQATDNLAAVIKNGPFPWPVTFSFARALQDPALFTWKGKSDNEKAAREAFAERLRKNTIILP